MEYDDFLAAIYQMSEQKKAKIVLQGSMIFIETAQSEQTWNLSTKIYHSEGFLPALIRDCLSTNGYFKWQDRSSYLQYDAKAKGVYLKHEVQALKKYIPFKYLMKDFIEVADQWKEIFEEFAEKDTFAVV